MTKVGAVIVSAGKGERFAGGRKKQFVSLAGRPVLAHTLDRFENCPLVQTILLVIGEQDMDYCLTEIVERYQYKKISRIVPGGKHRQDSVKNGIDALSEGVDIVLIHDGVRPFITEEMIEKTIRAAIRFGAAAPGMPVKDTIKVTNPDGTVLKTLDRTSLWQVQTPQAFRTGLIRQALRQAYEDGFLGTDDASLVERLGREVHIIPGSYENIKITTPDDLALAQYLFRTGPASGEGAAD